MERQSGAPFAKRKSASWYGFAWPVTTARELFWRVPCRAGRQFSTIFSQLTSVWSYDLTGAPGTGLRFAQGRTMLL